MAKKKDYVGKWGEQVFGDLIQSREELLEKKSALYLLSYFYSEDVTVRQPSQDLGIDLIIEIPKSHKRLGWSLAVQVKEYLDIPSTAELNRVASALSRRRNLDELLSLSRSFSVWSKCGHPAASTPGFLSLS